MADIIERIIFDDSRAIPGINNVTNALKEANKAMEDVNEETKKLSDNIGKDVIKTNEQIAESTKKTAEAEKKALKEKVEATEIYGISLGKIKAKVSEYRTDLMNTIKVIGSYIKLSKTQEEGVSTLSNLFGGGSKAIRLFATGFNILKVAIAASGIGALILGLGGLISFLTSTQKGMDLLREKTAFLGGAFDVVKGKASQVGNAIIESFSNGTVIEDFGKLLQSQIINRVTGIIDVFKNLWSVVTGGGKSLADVGASLGQVVTGINDETLKETANEILEVAKAAESIQKQLTALKREQAAFNVQFASSRAEIERLKKIGDDTTKTFNERIEAVRKGGELESFINKNNLRFLTREIELTQQRINLKGQENITDADRQTIYDLQLKKAESLNDSLGKQTEIQNTINGLFKEYRDAVKSSQDALFEIAKTYNLINNQDQFEFVKQKQIEELEKMLILFKQGAVIGSDFTKEINLINQAIEGLKSREYFDENVAAIQEFKSEIKGIAIEIPKIDPKLIIPSKKDWQDQFLEFLEGVETSSDLFNKIIDELFSFQDGEKIRGFAAGLKEFVNVFGAILNEATEIQLTNIDKQLERLTKRREQLENDLGREQELYEKGLANNLTTKKSEVDGLLAEEERLSAERDKVQRDAQRRQILAETAQQTQALITSSINIVKGFSNIPIVGLPLGIAAVATLLSFFAKTKVDALKATKLYEGANRIDDFFGVPNKYGRSDIGNQKGYRLVDEDNGERTNVIISAREMLVPEKIYQTQKVFFDNLKAGVYNGYDLSNLIAQSTMNKGLGVTNINHTHVNLPKEKRIVRQFVPFTGSDGKQRAILKTITEDMADGTLIEFGY